MAETRRVAGPSSPLGGRDGRAIALLGVAVLIAIVKPWGSTTDGPARTPVPAPSPSAVSSPSPRPDDPFDFGVFEGFEPPPAWEIWPAGREISFGFAMRVDPDLGFDDAPAPPSPGASPGSAASASATASPRGIDPRPPTWSDTIAISPASTLTVVAINTPLEYTIPGVRLTRLGPGGGRVEVPIARVRSPWPDHFLIVGIDDGSGVASRTGWPPGSYELELTIEPGTWTRTIRIDVRPRTSRTTEPPEASGAAPSAGQR
jgi:hypothetical protein